MRDSPARLCSSSVAAWALHSCATGVNAIDTLGYNIYLISRSAKGCPVDDAGELAVRVLGGGRGVAGAVVTGVMVDAAYRRRRARGGSRTGAVVVATASMTSSSSPDYHYLWIGLALLSPRRRAWTGDRSKATRCCVSCRRR